MPEQCLALGTSGKGALLSLSTSSSLLTLNHRGLIGLEREDNKISQRSIAESKEAKRRSLTPPEWIVDAIYMGHLKLSATVSARLGRQTPLSLLSPELKQNKQAKQNGILDFCETSHTAQLPQHIHWSFL